MTGHLPAGPRAVELDRTTGTLRMGGTERRLDDATGSEAVFGAYLSLLYAVRGAQRGEELPLRAADLEALLEIVGEDPDYIENRLVELMGCTPEEASLLKRVLLRHRALAATAGVAATLSLGALLGTASASSDAPPPPPAAVVTTPEAPPETPPLEAWLTTDDGRHVPVPQDWASEAPLEQQPAEAPEEEQVAPQEAAPVVPAQRPAARTAPQAPAAPGQPATAPAAPAPAQDAVVVGEPRAPIDRPGSWIQPPQPGEDEVVLGPPQVIDRPGSWIQPPQPGEDEVVLG